MNGPTVLTADKLEPGDWISEFGDTVTSVTESQRYSGIREVTFDAAPGVFYLFFADVYHVARPGTADDGDDRQGDDAPARTDAWEW